VPVDAGLGSRAPVGCCFSREGLAVAGRDWIVAAGAVALADASPQMTSLSFEYSMHFVRAAFGWALRLCVVGATGGWRRLGEQRVRSRAERLLRIAWLAGELADIVLLTWALPQMAQLTTLDLSCYGGTTSPALCGLIA
jgi:hypothetical protein